MVELYEPIKKPVFEAVQFNGWTGLQALLKWLGQGFFVPTGYEHKLRQEHELDRSRSDTLVSAPSYLVLNISGTDIRVDEYSWIAKDSDGVLKIYDNPSFQKLFRKYAEPTTNAATPH